MVEGKSDEDALFIPISRIYDEINEEIEIFFLQMQDDKRNGGDIKSRYGIKPENIERLIDKLFVNPFLKKYGFYSKDLLEIIQILDTDGAYIDDKDIVLKPNIQNCTVYSEKIYTDKVDKIIERNTRKRDNLNYLVSLDKIKIDSKKIDYSIYYFSSNLDHFLHKDANVTEREKRIKAQRFSTFNDSTELFADFFRKDPDSCLNDDYESSWEFITKGNYSLRRHTNINILLDRIFDNSDNY